MNTVSFKLNTRSCENGVHTFFLPSITIGDFTCVCGRFVARFKDYEAQLELTETKQETLEIIPRYDPGI